MASEHFVKDCTEGINVGRWGCGVVTGGLFRRHVLWSANNRARPRRRRTDIGFDTLDKAEIDDLGSPRPGFAVLRRWRLVRALANLVAFVSLCFRRAFGRRFRVAQKDVARLQIAMDPSVIVRVLNGAG